MKNRFYGFDDVRGQRKAELVGSKKHKVVCAGFPWNPCFRFTWEWIQENTAKEKARTVEHMRKAKARPELAEKYEAMVTESPTEVFCRLFTTQILPKVIAGYKPSYGLDIDVLLLADHESAPSFLIEVFPRYAIGMMENDFGSTIQFDVPLCASVGYRPAEVMAHIVLSAFLKDNRPSEEQYNEWAEHKGLWKITDERMLSVLLSEACFSHIETTCPESKPMVHAGTARDMETGEDTTAILMETVSS